MKIKDKELAYLLLRLGAAISLIGHAVPRILAFGEFHLWLTGLSSPFLPYSLVSLMAYVIPASQLILGAFLLAGYKLRMVMPLACVLMFCLIFGLCLLQKWDAAAIQTITLFIYVQLIANLKHQRFCLDREKSKHGKYDKHDKYEK